MMMSMGCYKLEFDYVYLVLIRFGSSSRSVSVKQSSRSRKTRNFGSRLRVTGFAIKEDIEMLMIMVLNFIIFHLFSYME